MRYYEYISTAKIEMLYPQVSRTSKSVEMEVGVDLKLLKFSRKTSDRPKTSAHDEIEALEELEEWIYANEPVGSIEGPQSWIYGRCRLTHAIFASDHYKGDEVYKYGVVLYAGKMENHAYLLMGGSAEHLRPHSSSPGALPTRNYRSNLPTITSAAREYVARECLGENRSSPLTGGPSGWSTVEAVEEMVKEIRVNKAEYEFLAKRLNCQINDENTSTIATPLFVALAD